MNALNPAYKSSRPCNSGHGDLGGFKAPTAGTGKTVVARIVGELLVEMGVIQKVGFCRTSKSVPA